MCEILVIMLLVWFEEGDKVCGLEIGVDDYVMKLYLVIELMVCVWI